MNKVMPCEVYSRVVGYYRPVNNWNKGKKQEFNDRVTFSVNQEEEIENSQSKNVDSYKIFTYPDCDKCEEVKSFLKETPVSGAIVDLKSSEGHKEFKQHYTKIKDKIQRTEDGSLKLPIVLFMQNNKVISAAQSLDETKKVLA